MALGGGFHRASSGLTGCSRGGELIRAVRWMALGLVLSILVGCGTSHNARMDAVLAMQRGGNLPGAIARLDSDAPISKDLLFHMERAALLRNAARYEESLKSLQEADTVIQSWEDDIRKSAAKYLENALAVLTVDRVRSYEGQDYEKVMLTTLMALDRLALGDWETARVDIRRTHEREDLIADLREKELDALKEKAKKDEVSAPTMQTVGGYPVEVFDDPAVKELRNGYQSALSHYLAGFVYEALGEGGLAAPGYRKALELKPGHPVITESLRDLDRRMASTRSAKGTTDLLVVIESGLMPKRVAQPVVLPIVYRRSRIPVNFALPRMAESSDKGLQTLTMGGKSHRLHPIVDLGAMARRSLKDEMPGMMLRAAMRMIVQGAVTEAASKAASKGVARKPDNAAALAVGVTAELAKVAFVVTQQQIDDRMWRSLPERIYVARLRVPSGDYDLKIDGRDLPQKVSVNGRYAVLPLRVDASQAWLGALAAWGGDAGTETAKTIPTGTAELQGNPDDGPADKVAAGSEPAVVAPALPSKASAPDNGRNSGKKKKGKEKPVAQGEAVR